MRFTPIGGTLAYLLDRDRDQVLMIRRNARADDDHFGKVNGLGGKVEPTGGFVAKPDLLARSSILLFPTGTRKIELVRGQLPGDVEGVEMRAVLRNPGAVGEYLFSPACEEVRVGL